MEIKKYQIKVFLGYEDGDHGISHSLTLADPDNCDVDQIVDRLVDELGIEEDGESDFNWNEFQFALPQSLVDRIKREAIEEYLKNSGKEQ